jgi:hypothetical protein
MYETKIGYRLPDDLKQFYARCNGATLFNDGEYGPYEILPLADVTRTRVCIYGDDADTDDFAPASWYAICYVGDSNYVGIDLASPDGQSNNMIDCFHETHGAPGYDTIIAKSFTEFLQRAYASNGNHYWLEPGFKDYGEALRESRARKPK